MALLRKTLSLSALTIAALLAAGPGLARAAQEEPPQLAEDTQDTINETVRPASDAKQWDKVLTAIDGILAKVPPDSYDAAVMYSIRAQTCLQKSDPSGALDALERGLAISDQHHFFSDKITQETVYNISQLNYQEGATTKDPKVQVDCYAKTQAFLERWLKNADPTTLTQDNIQFISSVYFTLGQGMEIGGTQKTNVPMMETALQWIDRGLRAAATPRDVFYQLKISALFQLERWQEGYEYLELRLHEKPDNKSYWQQLAFTYMQLANTAAEHHDDKAIYTYNVRAILTLERAQQLGFLNSPKDNYNLVGIFFTIGQYDRACERLAAGLENGGIESTRQNWELLAYSYQQQHKDLKAVQTLEEATKVFPKSGQLEYQIAQIYSGIDREQDALAHIKLCVAKGGTEKPSVGWLFYAWISYDLKDYDDAMTAVQEAAKYPEAEKEAARMMEAIKASVQDRANQLNVLQGQK